MRVRAPWGAAGCVLRDGPQEGLLRMRNSDGLRRMRAVDACLRLKASLCTTNLPSKPTRSAPMSLILRRPPLGPSRRTHTVSRLLLPLQFLRHRPPPRNRRQPLMPAGNQPLFLLPRPALDLPLARMAVGEPVIHLGEDEPHRAAEPGVAVMNAFIMLPDPRLDRLLGRGGGLCVRWPIRHPCDAVLAWCAIVLGLAEEVSQ